MSGVLDGKVVAVTGASRGMGRKFVDALLSEGARVVALARSSPDLDALRTLDPACLKAIACDVADPDDAGRGIGEAAATWGRLDALVNNAAIFHPFRIEDARDEQVLRHVQINLLGPVWCTRAAIPHLRTARGQVVSVSSESVRMPFPFLTVYAATKAALETLSAGLRDELREDGIRVTVLRSGSVSGGTGGREWDPAVTQAFYETIKRTGHAGFTGHPASPESMARALVAVLSLPEDVNVDLIEARGAGAGTEQSLARSAAQAGTGR